MSRSEPGRPPRLLKRISIQDGGSGYRAFGRTCPLRIVHMSESCPSSGPLGQGQQCPITLRLFARRGGRPRRVGLRGLVGPIGGDAASSSANSCVPVRAHVLAAASGANPRPGTSAPGSASPAKPGAAKPSTPTTGRPAIPVTSPWSGPTTPPPPAVPLAWRSAGAFIWHTDGLDPTHLGQQMRANGFGWVAIRVQDGRSADQVDPDWIAAFRQASGLPVGGWASCAISPSRRLAWRARRSGSLGSTSTSRTPRSSTSTATSPAKAPSASRAPPRS